MPEKAKGLKGYSSFQYPGLHFESQCYLFYCYNELPYKIVFGKKKCSSVSFQ